MLDEIIKFLRAFGESKIPSILFMVVCFYFGGNLIIEGNESVISTIIIAAGLIFGMITFLDYRSKTQADDIIKREHKYNERLLLSYKNALNDVSKTHSAFENSQQKNFTGGGENTKQYISEKKETTQNI